MSLIRARFRPMLRLETVVLVVVVWMIATMNGSWWIAAGAGRSWSDAGTWEFFAGTFVALVCLHFVLLAPWMNRWTSRPLLSLVVVASAAAAYYTRTYAVMLDPAMIRNILHTDAREARELLSWSLVGSVLSWTALPLGFIWCVRIERRRWPGAMWVRLGSVGAALAIAILAILPVNRDLTSLMRNHRELRYLITPGNYIYGLAGSVAREARDARAPREPVGTDAHLIPAATARKPRLFVLVIGETARAANFSL
jgi:lipid A ethanolaminephosphotransferase